MSANSLLRGDQMKWANIYVIIVDPSGAASVRFSLSLGFTTVTDFIIEFSNRETFLKLGKDLVHKLRLRSGCPRMSCNHFGTRWITYRSPVLNRQPSNQFSSAFNRAISGERKHTTQNLCPTNSRTSC